MNKENFTFFYKSNSPFSQWYSCVFKDNNSYIYNCAEQWMMAEKARLFKDTETLRKIMKAEHPREQKTLGRKVKNFNEGQWNKTARIIVYNGNYLKFTQNPKLLEKLLATSPTTLVEASPYDTIWGIGLDKDDPRAHNRDTWRGKNWLGEVLTLLREDILNGKKPHTQ